MVIWLYNNLSYSVQKKQFKLFSCSAIYEEQTPQAICASNNLFGITPESVGNKLKKGMYNMIICLFNY